MSTLIAAITPLFSVLLGGALTYWLNVRNRRSKHFEDLFNTAIAATAVADVSQHYAHLQNIGRVPGLSDEDYQDIGRQLVRRGLDNYFKRATEAREAIARVVPYEPRVKPYYQNPVFVADQIQQIMGILADAKARYT